MESTIKIKVPKCCHMMHAELQIHCRPSHFPGKLGYAFAPKEQAQVLPAGRTAFAPLPSVSNIILNDAEVLGDL